MFSVEFLIMVSVLVFCVGALLGAVISRVMFPPEQQKKMEENLKASRQELDQYQQEVAQHFADTAQLVNNLTQSYRDVHDHFAGGALKLTNPEITQKILEAGDSSLGIEAQNSLNEHDVQAPRDWAPKVPGSTGTLSEEYGLGEQDSAQEAIKPKAT